MKQIKYRAQLGKSISIHQAAIDVDVNNKKKMYTGQEKPTFNDRRNMDTQREEGIKFYENGGTLDCFSKEELAKVGFYFKQGYEIAKRRAYAKTLDSQNNKAR